MTDPMTTQSRDALTEELAREIDAIDGVMVTLADARKIARLCVARVEAATWEAAANVADKEERAATDDIASYGVYGGPTVPARCIAVERAALAHGIAAALRAKAQPPRDNEGQPHD